MRLDDIFTISNGLQAGTVSIFEKKEAGRIAILRPSHRFRGTVLGYVNKNEIPERLQFSAGSIFVSTNGEGSHTYSYVAPFPFTCNSDVAALTPKIELSLEQKLYYAECITRNRWLFSYGRKPKGERLSSIELPHPNKLPKWVYEANLEELSGKDSARLAEPTPLLSERNWKLFLLSDLFELKKGKRLTKANMNIGKTPFIGAVDKNNGLTAFVSHEPIHSANTITVNYNGNGVADAYYQPVPYWCSDDVNVLYPKFELTPSIAFFINTIIRNEKYRFSYGRKWHLERMKNSAIWLPATETGAPDWGFMTKYIDTLPFSSQV
jgi:restriction endonuclease S subunit